MRADLPGQIVMFPELEPAEATRGASQAAAEAIAQALHLPAKATCTVGEASACTGISKRQIRYYVEDGTLLAVNAARTPAGMMPARTGVRENKLDRWRIVVRRGTEFAASQYGNFLTLDEFIKRRLNQEN